MLWGKPAGVMLRLNTEADLIKLINKMGVHDEHTLNIAGIHLKYRQMTPEELAEEKLTYDPEMPENTEVFMADYGRGDFNIIPMFDKNQFMTFDEQLAKRERGYVFNLTPGTYDLDKDTYPSFPVVLYAVLDNSYGRGGSLTIEIWNVSPIDSITTVDDLQRIEDEHGEKWVNNLDTAIEMHKRLEAARQKEQNQ